MAFKGDITLDGKEYLLTALPQKTFVNQMAPAIGQGESKYQDGTSWAAWIQKDWTDGAGKLDPLVNPGYLYGEAESRVPSQLILPAFMNVSDTKANADTPYRYIPPSVTSSLIVTDRQDLHPTYPAKLAFSFVSPASWANLDSFDLYILGRLAPPTIVDADDSIDFAIYTNVAGLPGASVGTGLMVTTTASAPVGYSWYRAFMSIFTMALATATTYWIVIQPGAGNTNYMEVCLGPTGGNGTTSTLKRLDGVAWTTVANLFVPYFTNISLLKKAASTASHSYGAGFYRFNDTLYAYADSATWKWNGSKWVAATAFLGALAATEVDVTGVATLDDATLYVGNTPTAFTPAPNYISVNAADVRTIAASQGFIFSVQKGLLYRAIGNQLEYTDDGVTWEPTTSYGSPTYVGPSRFAITGIGSLGENVYVATEDGLYLITPGDYAIPVLPWHGFAADNGRNMVTFGNALYITVGGRIIRYTEDNRGQDVWLSKDDDFLDSRIGKVYSLCGMNQWLVALVGPTTAASGGVGIPTVSAVDGAWPSVWALQNDSWHQIATVPVSDVGVGLIYEDYDIFYDRPTQKLWVMTPSHIPYYYYVPNLTVNPLNDPTYTYAPTAWVEWDWFDGNIFEVLKDYDEVAIIGEGFSASQFADVWWKDDASTTWEYLGQATSNVTKLRWTVAMGTRPSTRRFKLGVLLTSKSGTASPRVRAIRVKYMPMLRDWYQWNLQVDVAGTAAYPQEGINGEVNTRTVATIHTDLQTVAKGVGTYLYTDIDGTVYEVKVKSANFPYTKFEYNRESGLKEYEGVWNLTLEQATTDPYVA